jgi:hypothetical protein
MQWRLGCGRVPVQNIWASFSSGSNRNREGRATGRGKNATPSTTEILRFAQNDNLCVSLWLFAANQSLRVSVHCAQRESRWTVALKSRLGRLSSVNSS